MTYRNEKHNFDDYSIRKIFTDAFSKGKVAFLDEKFIIDEVSIRKVHYLCLI